MVSSVITSLGWICRLCMVCELHGAWVGKTNQTVKNFAFLDASNWMHSFHSAEICGATCCMQPHAPWDGGHRCRETICPIIRHAQKSAQCISSKYPTVQAMETQHLKLAFAARMKLRVHSSSRTTCRRRWALDGPTPVAVSW